MSIENLKVGNYFSIIESNGQVDLGFDGRPYKVEAISTPFILCSFQEEVMVFDSRLVKWTKNTKLYVSKYKKLYQKLKMQLQEGDAVLPIEPDSMVLEADMLANAGYSIDEPLPYTVAEEVRCKVCNSVMLEDEKEELFCKICGWRKDND